jgi:hypothetical protein
MSNGTLAAQHARAPVGTASITPLSAHASTHGRASFVESRHALEPWLAARGDGTTTVFELHPRQPRISKQHVYPYRGEAPDLLVAPQIAGPLIVRLTREAPVRSAIDAK